MRLLKIILITPVLLIWVSAISFSQEIESDLMFIPTEGGRVHSYNQQVRGGSPPMALPFLDDFAWPSFFEESGIDRPELVRWDTSPVRRTSTFALNPPTIGVATLDGLDAGGYPYSFNVTDAHGWADTLTSRKILLGGLTADDEVVLTFYYEGGGVGNGPDEGEDTLIVEFKSIGFEEDIWTRVWYQVGFDSTEFTQVTIPIVDGEYLHNSFQFRFRNFGTLMGNADLWHIDYVFVAQNGQTGNPDEELAFREPAYSLLRSFSAMPWTHFSYNPAFYMKDSLFIECNNFGSVPDNQDNTGITVRLEAPGALPTSYTNEFLQVNIPVGSFSTEFLADLENSTGQADLVFDTSLSDSIATFEVSLWEDEVGYYTDQTASFDNDSIGFRQVFDNYFAYDDGSAEKAYSLDAIGGQIAVRYPLAIPDTLEGISIHFTPFYENSENHTFVLKVWNDDAGMPGELIENMYQFHNPMYFTEGYDVFAYYPMDQPVPVSGTIHVGFIQQDIDRLNVGLDKTTNANAGNLHYMLGVGGNWAPSEISGSVMIRPVLRAGKELITSVDDLGSIETSESLVSELYPNPASSLLSFVAHEPLNWEIVSMSGQSVRQGAADYPGPQNLDTSDLPQGLYMLVISSIESSSNCYRRFIIQH